MRRRRVEDDGAAGLLLVRPPSGGHAPAKGLERATKHGVYRKTGESVELLYEMPRVAPPIAAHGTTDGLLLLAWRTEARED